jgi:uncharacterized protein YegL
MSDLESSVGLEHPEESHCATVLVLDVSGSMSSQDKIGQLNAGLKFFKEDVMSNNLARKRVDLAVVTFGNDVKVTHDFSSIESFEPPALAAVGNTPMGGAILKALEMVESRKQEYKDQAVSYFRPWVFLLTDGDPTDMNQGDALWSEVVQKVHDGEQAHKFLFFAVAVDPARTDLLEQIAPPNRRPLQLREGCFRELFQWLSRSQVKFSCSKVGDQVQVDSPSGWTDMPT